MMASRLYTEALALGLESEMHLKVLYNRASANYECEVSPFKTTLHCDQLSLCNHSQKSKASFIELVQADCRELLSKKKDHFKA